MTATIVSTNVRSGPPSSVLNAFAIDTRVTSSPPTRWLKSESTGIGAYNVLMIGSSGPVTFLISLMIGPMTWPNTSPASIWTRLNEIASGSTPPPESAPGSTLFHCPASCGTRSGCPGSRRRRRPSPSAASRCARPRGASGRTGRRGSRRRGRRSSSRPFECGLVRSILNVPPNSGGIAPAAGALSGPLVMQSAVIVSVTVLRRDVDERELRLDLRRQREVQAERELGLRVAVLGVDEEAVVAADAEREMQPVTELHVRTVARPGSPSTTSRECRC